MSEISIAEKIAETAWLEGLNLEAEDSNTGQAVADQRKAVIRDGRELMNVLGIEVEESVRKPIHGGGGFASLSGQEPLILRGSQWKELRNGERGDNFEPIYSRISEVMEQGAEGVCTSLRVERLTGGQIDDELLARYGMFAGIAGHIFVHRPALETAWSGFVSDADRPCMYRTGLLTGRLLGDTTGDLEALAEGMHDIARSEVAPRLSPGGLEILART